MLAKKPKGAVERRQSSGAASLLWMFVGALLTVMCLVVLYLWNPFDIGSETKTEQRTVEPINQPTSTETNDFEFYDLLPDQEMISLPDEAVFEDENNAQSPNELEPDVVVTRPREETRESGSTGDAENFGISEERTITEAPSQQTPAASGEQDIVIVEEEGTYDDPAVEHRSSAPSNTQRNATNSSATQANTSQTSAKKSYILQINSFSSAEEADKRRAQVLMAGVDAQVVKNKMNNGQVIYQVVSPTMTNRQRVVAAQQRLQNNGIDSLIVEQRR